MIREEVAQGIPRNLLSSLFLPLIFFVYYMSDMTGAGRYAPSPSGRMHLGNIFSALIAWLSARTDGERFILRIEDLDPQRSKREYARLIEDDLQWLGLDFDEGGLGDKGDFGPYSQSLRHHLYDEALKRLQDAGMTYPCRCTRAELLATQAPHASDGRRIYPGTCRPPHMPTREINTLPDVPHATRLYLPDEDVCFVDEVFGQQRINLAREFGDIVLQRADGAWAYQLAVVVDDALMGVRRVVRGHDLLSSSAPQIYLHRLLGFEPPKFLHVPLICNSEGKRLSKRDGDLNMESLRKKYSPEQIIGYLGYLSGLLPYPEPITPADLLPLFSSSKIPRTPQLILPKELILP